MGYPEGSEQVVSKLEITGKTLYLCSVSSAVLYCVNSLADDNLKQKTSKFFFKHLFYDLS